MLKDIGQSEFGSSRKPNARKRTNVSLGVPDVNLHHILIRMLKTTNQSEPASFLKETYWTEQLADFQRIAYFAWEMYWSDQLAAFKSIASFS